MFLPSPRGLASADLQAERRAMLETESSAQPLRRYLDALRTRRPSHHIPEFDPADAGSTARVLLLFTSPTSGSDDRAEGSGFVSVDNDDDTSENLWNLREEADLGEHVLTWNVVPWHHEGETPTTLDQRQGAGELRRLLPLLPNLVTVVLGGTIARNAWTSLVEPFVPIRDLTVIPSWQTAPKAVNLTGKRNTVLAAFTRARHIVR